MTNTIGGSGDETQMKIQSSADRKLEPARLAEAEARANQAEARTALAKTRAEAAETRTEQAETRIDLAKTRTEQAESRTEQAETTLQNLVDREVVLRSDIPGRPLKNISANVVADWQGPFHRLTIRQREILQLERFHK
jgi:chromosome segregation ATPase